MQPDRRFDFQLESELAAAGAVARSAGDQAPAPAFASGLRSHLLTAHAAAGAARARPMRSRLSRFAPLFAAMLALVLATVVAAAAFRLFAPPPAPPAAPTPQPVVAALTGGATFTPTPSPTPSPTPTPSPEPTTTPTPTPTPAPTPEPAAVPAPVAHAPADPGADSGAAGDRRHVPWPGRLPRRRGHRVVERLRPDLCEVPHASERLAGHSGRLSAPGRRCRGGYRQVGHDGRRQRLRRLGWRPA